MAEPPGAAFDIAVRHQVFIERLKAGQVKTLLPFLKEIDQGLRIRLSKGEITNYSKKRLTGLLAGVDTMIEEITGRYIKELTKDLRALAVSEGKFEAASLDKILDQVVPSTLRDNKAFEAKAPSSQKILAAATAAPLSVRGIHGGKLLDTFIKDWGETQRKTFTGMIRRGSAEGQTNAEIVRALRGTSSLGFQDGAIATMNRQASAMTRTAVQHISSAARMATFEANSDLVQSYKWVSTLDNVTSDICQGLSGEIFPVGEGPLPPAHINCRSQIVAVLDPKFDFLREDRTQSGQFGPVDQKETYFSWIKKQPAKFQDKTLGPVKAKLLRDGGLSTKEFQRLTRSSNYEPLTLREMQKLDPVAFEKAGIRISDAGAPALTG
jgi:SPP1 gp7 family putative phage head morphogenesis protein